LFIWHLLQHLYPSLLWALSGTVVGTTSIKRCVRGTSKLHCVSMIFCIAIYQLVVMPYQARCYDISALWQAMNQG